MGHVQIMIDNCLVISSYFSSLTFSFCLRSCNGVAYRLAKWAACGLSDEVWDSAPTWIGDVLYSDFVLSEY